MLCQLSYAGILHAESLQRNEKTIYMLHAYKANRRVAMGSMRIRHADCSSLPVDLDDLSPLSWMKLLHYTPSGLAVPLDRCDTNRCSTGPVDGSHSTACASTGGRGIANPYNSFEYPHNPRMFTHIGHIGQNVLIMLLVCRCGSRRVGVLFSVFP